MKNSILFLGLVLSFVSCKQTTKQSIFTNKDYTTIYACTHPFNQEKKLKLSDFVEDLDIIPLELTEASLLSVDIDKIRIHDDNILVLESRNSQCVFRFDSKGKFLNRIGKKGQAPNEFIELTDFCLDEEADIVFLLDNARRAILCYTMNGEFIKSIPIGITCMRMEYQNGLFYIFEDQPYQENSYSLEVKNQEGKTLAKYFPSKRYMHNHSIPAFNKQDDRVLFYRSMNDTIYELKEDTLSYAYYVDFDSYKLTSEEVENIYQGKISTMNVLTNKERVSGLDFVTQVGNILFFQTGYGFLTYLYLYDIKKTELSVSGGGFLEDDFYYMFFSNAFCGSSEDALIGVYDANGLEHDIKTLDYFEKNGDISSKRKQEIKNKMFSLCIEDEEMNPWVLVYRIKEE